MPQARSPKEVFEAIFHPYRIELEDSEIAALQKQAEQGDATAELDLILLDFYGSTMHYDSFNGSKDELDDVQVAVFAKLDALGKKLPLAYKVAGDLYLGTMGKIVWHCDLARPYFEKYAAASGDTSILDDFESYTNEKWQGYKEASRSQQVRRILEASKTGITYSHDPQFYENLRDE